MKKFLFVVCCLTVSMFEKISATKYSLDDCFTAGIKNDTQLAILHDETDKDRISETNAVLSFSPEITASGTFKYTSDVPELDLSEINPMLSGTVNMGKKDNKDLCLSITEVIFSGLSREYAVRLAQKSVETARLKEEQRQDTVRETILQLAYSYTLSQLGIDSLDAGIERLKLDLNRVQSFYDKGLIPEYDLIDISTKVQEQEIQKLTLLSNQKNILSKIATITGLTDISVVQLPSEYTDLIPESSIADAEQHISANTSLLVLHLTQDTAQLAKKRDKAAFLPIISGTGTLHYGNPGFNYTGDDWQAYYTAGISARLNLWDRGQKINMIKSDNLSIHQTDKATEDAERSLLQEISMDKDTLKSLKEQISLAENLLEMKNKQYVLVSDLWKKGQKSTVDILTAEQELTAADARVKNYRIQYLSLYHRILLLVNEPLWKKETKGVA